MFILISNFLTFAQNIQVDSQTFTPQQLIEDILIDSDCIENVVVTNVLGGDFNNTDQSYGAFNASGTSFPFQSGIVLSTGRLINVPGPNTTLSDDDAPNWLGDTDLEIILNESNTINATLLEFDFTAIANQISFRYIFASEEYQENDPNTCQYSDLFGFLIKPINDQQYTNIALVPGTQTPVKVTTVHPEIPNGCEAENEIYFESFNGDVSPINFNGQTKVLLAIASTIPNERYHVKLVIADEQNFRYDSAVFLEAGSFQLSTDLGHDRLIATNNPLCGDESLELDATQPGNNTYKWFKDSIELITETNAIYIATSDGYYNVEVSLQNNCIAYGEINIEYATNPLVFNSSIIQCDINLDGLTTYNLFDVVEDITNSDTSLNVTNFFLNITDATQNINEITDANSFENSIALQTVYARVENMNNCFSIAEVLLDISSNSITILPLNVCDDENRDGITEFDLTNTQAEIELLSPADSVVLFYNSVDEALNDGVQLGNNYQNSSPYSETIYARVINNNDCFALIPITLNVLENPELLPDEDVLYCLNIFPDTILLEAGIINDSPNNYVYQWFLNGTDLTLNEATININEVGVYTVSATAFNGCSSTRIITVLSSNTATIEAINITEASTNNTITITISGEGNYEFSLNHGAYQDSNLFTYVIPGFHTVYVRDKNGCGLTEELVSVFGFPKFFTPNGDTYNDTWKPLGVNEQFHPNIKVIIFNRLGKLIKEINPLGTGWDGTFNGQDLPNGEFWFVITLPNGKEYHGHFALVR